MCWSKCSATEIFIECKTPNHFLETLVYVLHLRSSILTPNTGDRGSRAALYGLFANIGLTGLKGVAGWWVIGRTMLFLLFDLSFLSSLVRYLSSASLIADAGHSLSGSSLHLFETLPCMINDTIHLLTDLLGDLVTLVCYTFSQRPPSMNYPYGERTSGLIHFENI